MSNEPTSYTPDYISPPGETLAERRTRAAEIAHLVNLNHAGKLAQSLSFIRLSTLPAVQQRRMDR